VSLILYLLFFKHKLFRPSANVYLLMAGPIQLASLWVEGVNLSSTLVGDSVMSFLVAWPLSCAIWLTYLNRSKRVRLTYEGLVFNKPPTPPTIDVASTQPRMSEATTHNDLLWSQAMQEAEGENRQVALWARCFAEADGDEAKAKARYIKQRVEVLSR
jgi:hypothetical protein